MKALRYFNVSPTKLNFCYDFFERKRFYSFYQNLVNVSNGENYSNSGFNHGEQYVDRLYVVNYIPPYLKLNLVHEKSAYKKFAISHGHGFLIDLDGYSDVESYAGLQMGRKNKNTIRRRLKRLETCFDIRYKIYYGEILQEECDFLLRKLHSMIKKRFIQRGGEHQGLKKWDFYKQTVYEMILEKKASFTVIYNNDIPIAISLGFQFQNIFDSAVSSYDIDYSKFGLGNTIIWKQLEWCFENDFKIFDLRWGPLMYKRLWCNKIHNDYVTHVIYYKNDLGATILAVLLRNSIVLKDFLLKQKTLTPLKVLRKRLFVKKSKPLESKDEQTKKTYTCVATKLITLPSQKDINLICINKKTHDFLLRYVYDFQYSNKLHATSIEIYAVINNKNSFIIKGGEQIQKLVFV